MILSNVPFNFYESFRKFCFSWASSFIDHFIGLGDTQGDPVLHDDSLFHGYLPDRGVSHELMENGQVPDVPYSVWRFIKVIYVYSSRTLELDKAYFFSIKTALYQIREK